MTSVSNTVKKKSSKYPLSYEDIQECRKLLNIIEMAERILDLLDDNDDDSQVLQ